jgi:DNA-directed RNA polymerase II subunit RPB4
LEKQHLHEFEVAQLGNLCPEDADEAKALVPSLALLNIDGEPRDIDSASLTEVLQQICDCRQFD